MRFSAAVIAIAALSVPPLPVRAQTVLDSRLGAVLDSLPEIEVHVPSDRTEFSPIIRRIEIAPPDLPEIEARIPDGAEPAFRPYVPQVASQPAAPVARRPVVRAPVLPQPEDAFPGIVMLPDRPKTPPPSYLPQHALPQASPPAVASRPLVEPQPQISPPQIAPRPPVTAPIATVDRALLDAALDALARLQALPPALVQGTRAFYEATGYAPAWIENGEPTARARSLLALAERAGEHGLDPGRFRKLAEAARTASPETREAALSLLAAQYARDARGGRINPLQVSRLITATPSLPDTAALLAELKAATNPAAALEAWNPRHAGYLALKSQLAALRASDLTSSLTPAAVGSLAPAGRRDPQDAAADIIANMERWRWLPTDLGTDHVFVNIPSFSLTLQKGGNVAVATRVVVGKPQTPTPVFSDRMQFLVVNPYWNVPPSIALKEYLPQLQRNPYALQAKGLEVVSRGRVVDPATIDWANAGRSVAIRQPPGERNALGHIKFMVPNQHAVYLHDTPSRSLFGRDIRAYSHGCVRVQDPFRLAEAVLGGEWSAGRLKSMVGGGERQIRLTQELPVHLAYFTTFVDGAGMLHHAADIYGHNRRVKALLGL